MACRSFIILALGLACAGPGPWCTRADTLVFASGRTVTGTIVQTNAGNVLLLTESGALNYSPLILKEIRLEQAEDPVVGTTNRLRRAKDALLLLGRLPWAANLRQIPATVVDQGILRHVPYLSFRCGEDYEVNIYGDPDHPAGIEAGVYRGLLGDPQARSNCLAFMETLLGEPADRELLRRLDLGQDLRRHSGLTLEITPPSAADAYGGWWVSAYSEQAFIDARASDAEIKRITLARAIIAAGQSAEVWSPDDLQQVRHAAPAIITFYEKRLDQVITNAEVRPYVEGVSLIWRDGAGGMGIVKLADLPKHLQTRFGYAAEQPAKPDPASAAATNVPGPGPNSAGSPGVSATGSPGGNVYIRGYSRKDGAYTRPAPRQ